MTPGHTPDPLERLVDGSATRPSGRKSVSKRTERAASSATPSDARAVTPSAARDVSVDDAGAEQSLDALTPFIDIAARFADRWPVYRDQVFGFALDRLRSGNSRDSSESTALHSAPSPVSSGVGLPSAKLSLALGVTADEIERVVQFDQKGRISILARIEGRSRRDLQSRYSLVYLYVKEVGLGQRLVDIEDLRGLCIDVGCYDLANFTSNFKKDVTDGMLREQADKGARSRRYMLSQKGVGEAAAILREMVRQ